MQLLPPLLDGLHARRLAGLSDAARGAERLPLKLFFDTLVGAAKGVLIPARFGFKV